MYTYYNSESKHNQLVYNIWHKHNTGKIKENINTYYFSKQHVYTFSQSKPSMCLDNLIENMNMYKI
jgi:hypothetical protein